MLMEAESRSSEQIPRGRHVGDHALLLVSSETPPSKALLRTAPRADGPKLGGTRGCRDGPERHR